MAAIIAGCPDRDVIARHLLPSMLSYIIVSLTLAIPQMILAETSLSFLGLGLRAPITSWGVLLKEAQNDLHERRPHYANARVVGANALIKEAYERSRQPSR